VTPQDPNSEAKIEGGERTDFELLPHRSMKLRTARGIEFESVPSYASDSGRKKLDITPKVEASMQINVDSFLMDSVAEREGEGPRIENYKMKADVETQGLHEEFKFSSPGDNS